MVHSEPVGYTERPIEDSCQYLEMIIPSQNTQVSSFRDLFKGCNKASGPLAKTFHTGAQQCSGAHRVCEGSSCSSEGQIGLYNPTCTEKKKPHLRNFSGSTNFRRNDGISIHSGDELSFHSVDWICYLKKSGVILLSHLFSPFYILLHYRKGKIYQNPSKEGGFIL